MSTSQTLELNKSLALLIYEIKAKIKEGNEINGFEKELNEICSESENYACFKTFDAAKKNLEKNRYGNILSQDDTRFKLNLKEFDSDYINANWISDNSNDSLNKSDYIAAQGPLYKTRDDFWQMIWDSGSKIIVMLTKVIEDGRVKCDIYWPQNKNLETRDFIVSVTQPEKKEEDITIRKFIIQKKGFSDNREITQLHYQGWPDQGIPNNIKNFMQVVYKCQEYQEKGPIIVHCSAGVGRTGCFIIIHNILKTIMKQLKEGKGFSKINVRERLLHFRKQRCYLINSTEQYEFCFLGIQNGLEDLLVKMETNEEPKLDPENMIINSVSMMLSKNCDEDNDNELPNFESGEINQKSKKTQNF